MSNHLPAPLRRIVTTVLATAAALLAVAPGAQAAGVLWGQPAAVPDAFSTPPSPLPAGKPGDVLRAERLDFSHSLDKQPPGMVGWRLLYLSRTALGDPVAVTGTILYRSDVTPPQGAANRPIVTYGNEFQGLGDDCAVSHLLVAGHTGELALMQPLLDAGYAVVSSDMQGLGTAGVHTFGVTIALGHDLLDMVRAARNFREAGLPTNGPLGIFGYSEGGGAAAGAAELASTYAPELKFSAAAYGGAPIDALAASRNIDGGPSAAINFVAAAGYDAAYPELHLTSFLNAWGKALLPKVQGSCIEIIPALAFQWFRLAQTKDLRDDPKWQARFAENRVGNRGVPFPTYYFHSVIDETAPYSSAVALRQRYCAMGTPLRFSPIVGPDHIASGPLWMPQAAKWLMARMQGSPDPGNCGQSAPPNSLG